ncbi:cytochrome c-type biogenesis protein CcmH [Sphingomicrobium astaxanthinifaciens]|uniref:cytochrome c-type biogenesis protein CcmH n=1 Tax=Sphingomicrobium astaxanthinifaciens TaxID=1227949 RepID=UPI001FCC6F45|nr:cytochrome c-type biogenesis protein CcmH [Sphingomicrobium astaxanthinifaciens]MCJ7420256.1 cytochrome c-type biogenesis protein CcmH [Sphingomicrobium astaxanthinifaciens]
MMALLVPLLLAAATPDYAYAQLEDPAREAAAVALMRELRCLTCEGQSIADSDADMAADMRRLVRARIAAGERPEEVRGWLVDRYGGAVSYRPVGSDPVSWPLFAVPVLLLLLAGWMVRGRFRRDGGA